MAKKASKKQPEYSFLQKLSLYFFKRPRKTAIIWFFITVFGIASYFSFMDRQGFPKIDTPYAVAQGSYLVNDPERVDKEVAGPLSDFILKEGGVKTVQTQSFGNFYTVIISYDEKVDAPAKSAELQKKVAEQKLLPEQATNKVEPFALGFGERGDDLTIAVHAKNDNATTEELAAVGAKMSQKIKDQNLSLVQDASVIEPFESATNPVTGQVEKSQKRFDHFGKREGDTNNFYNAAVIGVSGRDDVDELKLSEEITGALQKINSDPEFSNYYADISGSNADSINAQIDELQRTLIEGLLAVLIIGSIVIAIRASLITVISMITVISIAIGILFLTGYSLNTITLFGLILGLSLIVDDTIIMVEALDAQRRRRKNANEVVSVATKRVSGAMIAATSTAALSFAPLLFVGGILGEFIRAIPVTIISALVVSLIVALVFIPFFARFLLLRKNQMGEKNVHEFSAGIEARIAKAISAPMLWAKNSKKKLFSVGIVALIIGFGFIGTGGYIAQKVTFNIFPSSKDANQLLVTLTFAPGTTIDQAEKTATNAEKIVSDVTASNFVKSDYYATGGVQTAQLTIDVTDYKKRDVTGQQMVAELNKRFENFDGAMVESRQLDPGPPASAFTARVDSSKDRDAALRLAKDIGTYLESAELKRADGSVAEIKTVTPPDANVYSRNEGKQFVAVTAIFKDTDTSTLVTLAQEAVKKEFPENRVESYGLQKDAISYDFGQESENQDSFAALVLAFPILLVVIYFLLAIQFRSLLQPLLIFMAIPFSFFGISLGLYLTDNPFSFFAMLGFFALIGLSIKNTILLTDYANQSRRAGLQAVDAAHEALAERFRPLIATSLTAVVSLIPLALTSPFWEGLAVVLIFGLLSSTFLVITVFPYYYLGAEYLRVHIKRRYALGWIFITGLIVALAIATKITIVIFAPFIAALILYLIHRKFRKTA